MVLRGRGWEFRVVLGWLGGGVNLSGWRVGVGRRSLMVRRWLGYGVVLPGRGWRFRVVLGWVGSGVALSGWMAGVGRRPWRVR